MFDVAVVGGGINGCGIARDLAGRGLSVLLVERQDFASGTSSASTKLIHGGLRYLEQYEFALVREALREREVLLRLAPHIIWPMRFVLPHHSGLRPAWLIRVGLFLYDRLGGRELLPASHGVNLRRDAAGEPLQDEFIRGFEYSDCWVDDARLVVLNAVDAAARGADVRSRTELTDARRVDGHWRLDLSDARTGVPEQVAARTLVNAAGPWVADVIRQRIGTNATAGVRLVKGSHIVVPRLFAHDRAYIFQNADGRIVFAIPYERDFTLIGTTDVDYRGDPGEVTISDDEVAYLCDAVSGYFRQPVAATDVVWTYSGVRPLYGDEDAAAQDVSRDYVLELDGGAGEATLLNVFGGKITTYRHLAEEAIERMQAALPLRMGGPWTHDAPLPGGDFPVDGFEALRSRVAMQYDFLPNHLSYRLVRSYGTRVFDILGAARSLDDLGRHFGAGLYEAEVDHLVRREWAMSADDIIWRRSKLGLRLNAAEVSQLANWLTSVHPNLLTPAA